MLAGAAVDLCGQKAFPDLAILAESNAQRKTHAVGAQQRANGLVLVSVASVELNKEHANRYGPVEGFEHAELGAIHVQGQEVDDTNACGLDHPRSWAASDQSRRAVPRPVIAVVCWCYLRDNATHGEPT